MSQRRALAAPDISVEREPVTEDDLAADGVDIARDFPGPRSRTSVATRCRRKAAGSR